MSMIKVIFQPMGKTVQAQSGEKLLDIAVRAGLDIANFCGGQGVCLKCRVRILNGRVSFSSSYIALVTRKDFEAGFVLACKAEVLNEDVEVWIPPESRKEEEPILTVDHIIRYGEPAPLERGPEPASIPYFHPLCQKYHLDLPRPTLEDSLSDMDRIERELRKKAPDLSLNVHFSALWGLATLLRQNDWKLTATIHLRDRECPHIRVFEGGNTSGKNFGVAIDVGTTTIAAQLIDLRTGEILAVEASHNRQARYGEDVISRMIFACGHGGLVPLTEAVVNTINSLIDSMLAGTGIHQDDITCLVAAGNTTMTHLLLGLEPCTIRVEPYIPVANRFPPFQTVELGIQTHPKALLHCMPCVSSYVGGDITAGVLACGMNDQPGITALIDVGTNGEIVVGNSEWLVCCSSSAGPAFEGGGIKCGMRAVRGAIEKIWMDGKRVFHRTIGKGKPRGICGSALIDAVAELVAEGIIDQSAKFIRFDHPQVQVVDEVPEFVVVPAAETENGEPVVLTEDDIANFIKSKGAILAAMKVLLENTGISFMDLEQLYVAGGFGAHLDIEKAVFVGLLPDIPRERIQFVGNSSLAGARLAMLSSHAFHKAEAIARRMTYFELSVHTRFMEEFVAALFLPHTQMDLFPSFEENLARRRKTV